MSDFPENTGIIRDEKGKFVKGVSGNPLGKPKGATSPIAKVRQIFEDNPEMLANFVKEYMENPNNQKHIVEMLDGKPKGSETNVSIDKAVFIPILGGLSVSGDNGHIPAIETPQED